jgi:hypothetical protein
MSGQDKEDLQMRIRPIENGFILSGNVRGSRVSQRYFPDIAAVRSATIDHIDRYLRGIGQVDNKAE